MFIKTIIMLVFVAFLALVGLFWAFIVGDDKSDDELKDEIDDWWEYFPPAEGSL